MLISASKKFFTFLEMIKIEHSIFALPFAYLGLFLAERGLPTWSLFGWVTLAMVSFRTMAMALNRLIDLHIDSKNPRTSNRALPAGKLKPFFVWAMTIAFGALFVWTSYMLGPLCFKLAPIPIFLAFLYPFAKRFTWTAHLLLGLILGIAPYGAWIASRGAFSWVPGLMTLGVAFWVAGFDIIYALQDEEFDRREGLFSIPSRFGVKVSLLITAIFHVFTLTCWILAGVLAGLGWIYFAGIALVSFFLLREHWLIRSFGMKKVQEAFFSLNALVSLSVFLAVLIDLQIGGA